MKTIINTFIALFCLTEFALFLIGIVGVIAINDMANAKEVLALIGSKVVGFASLYTFYHLPRWTQKLCRKIYE